VLAARIVHELGSRLTIVLFELNKISDARARAVEADIAEMSATLYRLMTIACMEISNGVRGEAEMLHLDRIATTVIAKLQPLAEARSCKLSQIANQPEPFSGNHDAVMEAVRNLVENAIKHGPHGNHVLITCGPGHAIAVDDGGPGLKQSDPQRLFQPFERGETVAEGSGLGLTIVKLAIDLHRGSIEICRSSLGGARFALFFRSFESNAVAPRLEVEKDNSARLAIGMKAVSGKRSIGAPVQFEEARLEKCHDS
jgi:two-component system OmpR family sensor kinase